MVDVGDKEVTRRTATATGVLRTTAEVVAALRDDTVPKGDALARPGSRASWARSARPT